MVHKLLELYKNRPVTRSFFYMPRATLAPVAEDANPNFFPHVTSACQGVIFSSVELVKELIEKTHTKTGLQTFVHVIDKVYHTGRQVAADFKENMHIVFEDLLPRWNYRAIPLFQAIG